MTPRATPGPLTRFARALRVIFGMPDYTAYLDHCRQRHPGEPVLSRSEHYAQHLARRYGNGPSRCC